MPNSYLSYNDCQKMVLVAVVQIWVGTDPDVDKVIRFVLVGDLRRFLQSAKSDESKFVDILVIDREHNF